MTLKEFMEDDRYGIIDENALSCHGGRGGGNSRAGRLARIGCCQRTTLWDLKRFMTL
jgi:hypothetical protein